MGSEDIVNIDLDGTGRYKFVCLEVSDGKETQEVLVGRLWCDYHSDIVDDYKTRHSELKVQVRGGGRIKVTPQELHAYGYSSSFGRAPQEMVEKLLADYAAGTSQQVKVEMGVGY